MDSGADEENGRQVVRRCEITLDKKARSTALDLEEKEASDR